MLQGEIAKSLINIEWGRFGGVSFLRTLMQEDRKTHGNQYKKRKDGCVLHVEIKRLRIEPSGILALGLEKSDFRQLAFSTEMPVSGTPFSGVERGARAEQTGGLTLTKDLFYFV